VTAPGERWTLPPTTWVLVVDTRAPDQDWRWRRIGLLAPDEQAARTKAMTHFLGRGYAVRAIAVEHGSKVPSNIETLP
jgi:hypothetical protein